MTSWRRTEWLDCYVEDDEAVVMLPTGEVVAVTPLSWAVLESIERGPMRLENVAQRLVARFGEPDGAESPEQLTAATLDRLGQAGLVSPLD